VSISNISISPKPAELKRSLDRCLNRFLAALLVSLLLAPAVHAGNTWDGGGGDDNWGTGSNWSPDGAPSPGSGNDLYFAGTTRLTSFNNYTAFDDWRNIIFLSGAGSFNITGNPIDLFGKIENLSSNTQTIGFDIALNSSTANEFDPTNGNLTINSANIYNNGNQLKVFGNNGFTLSFGSGSNIQGSGSLAINQNSTVVFNSAHSYTGDTFVNAGQLQFAQGGSANSSIIRVGDTIANSPAATVSITDPDGGTNISSTIVVRPSSSGTQGTRAITASNTSGTNTFSGIVALDAAATITSSNAGGTLAFTGPTLELKTFGLLVNGSGNTTISNVISSTGAGNQLKKEGTGTLTLTGSNTYTGATNVTGSNSILAITNSLSLGSTAGSTFIGTSSPSVATGTLQLIGSGGNFAVGNETLFLRGIGAAGQSGALVNVSGDNSWGGTISYNIGSAANYRIGVDNGSTLTLTKTASNAVQLTGSSVQLSFGSTGGGNLIILGGITGGTGTVSTVAGSAITVTLSGSNTYGGNTTLNNSGTFVVGSDSAFGTGQFQFNGGTLRGDGTAHTVSNRWSISSNNGTIAGSSALTFTGTGVATANNTLLNINNSALTTFSSGFLISDGTAARNFTIGGSGNSLWSGNITDAVATAVPSGGAGSLRNNNTGTTTLTGSNTYTGSTVINSGTLQLGNGGSAGSLSTSSAISVGAGATFAVNQSDTVTQGVDFSGAPIANATGSGSFAQLGGGTTIFTAANTYNGTTTISSGVLQIGNGGTTGTLGGGNVINNASLVFNRMDSSNVNVSNTISGSGSLTTIGTAPIVLNGTNSYSGGTFINSGRVVVGNNSGLGNGDATLNGTNADLRIGNGTITGSSNNLVVADTGDNKLLSGFSGAQTFGGNITINETTAGNFEIQSGSGNTFTISGDIGGSGGAGIRKTGTGTVVLSGTNNTYSGTTVINNGTLRLGGAGVIPDGSVVDINPASGTATLDLNGFNETIAGLTVSSGAGSRFVDNLTASSTGTLTIAVTGSNSYDFGGRIRSTSGTVNIVKDGTGTQQLSGSGGNDYTGTTTVNDGTLALAKTGGATAIGGDLTVNGPGTVTYQGNDQVADTGAVTVNSGGTVDLAGFSDTLASLSLGTSGSTLKIAANQTGSAQLSATGAADLGTGNTLDLTGMQTTAGLYRVVGGSSLTGTFGTVLGLDSAYTLQYGTINANELDLQHKATISLALGSNAANVHVGSQTVNLLVGNTAPVQSADLNYTLGGVTGSGTVVAGNTDPGTGTYTAVAGVNSFSITASDANATNSPQSVSFSQTGYRYADPTAHTPEPINFGIVHQGATATQALSITNNAINDGFSESLNASIGGVTGDATTNGGSFSLLAAGSTDSASLVAGIDTTTGGVKSGTASISLVSDGTGTSGLGTTALASQTVNVSGSVFDGNAVWTGAGSTWGSGASANWVDSNGINAAPGTFVGFDNVDSATFDNTGTANTTVNLSGVTPSLKSLTFNSTGSYTVAGGADTLTMKSNAGNATITDSNGNHTISANVALASDTTVAVTNIGDALSVSGGINGIKGLVKTGSGTLDLTGANSYSGTTVVNGGSLLVNGSHTGAGAYTANSGGLLGGAGTITTNNAAITMNAGSTLSAGGSPGATGTLTLDVGTSFFDIFTEISLSNTQSLLFDLTTTASSDRVLLSNASSTLTIGTGVLEFDDFVFSTGVGFGIGVYTLFDTNSTISGTLGSGLSGVLAGYNAVISFANANQDIILTVTAIPEPATYGALAALGLAGLSITSIIRRRKRAII
jgi:autotransporter-associated beta strand protein